MTIKTIFHISDHIPIDELVNDMDVSLWESLLQQVSRFLGAPAVGIILTSEIGYQNIAMATTKEVRATLGKIIPRDVNVYCKEVYETKKQLYVENAQGLKKWQDNPDFTVLGFISYIGFPIFKSNGDVFATLCALDVQATSYEINQIELMECIRDIIQRELHTAEKLAEVRHESYHDELTNILNRRGITEKYSALLESRHYCHAKFSLLFFDLDGLKTVNDKWGHSVGDAYIRSFAQALKMSIRESDLCGRMGGDEFVAFCSSAEAHDANKIIKRITLNYESICQSLTVPCNASFSVGSICYNVPPKDLKEALKLADKQMYENKRYKQNPSPKSDATQEVAE